MIDSHLGRFPPTSLTYRLLDALLVCLPQADRLTPYASLAEAKVARFPGLKRSGLNMASDLANESRATQVISISKHIDKGDTGLTIFGGLRSALGLFFDQAKPNQQQTRQHQRLDAALKAIAMAYMVSRLLPGAPETRLDTLKRLPAGRQLLYYFAAIEVALPLQTDLDSTQTPLTTLVSQHRHDLAKQLVALIGHDGLVEAELTLDPLVRLLDQTVVFVAPHADDLADTIQNLMPGVLRNTVGSLASVVSTAADTLPVYELLISRLTAEACLYRAQSAQVPLTGAAGLHVLSGIQPSSGAEHPINPFADSLDDAQSAQNPFADLSPAAEQTGPPAWTGNASTIAVAESASVDTPPSPQPLHPPNPFDNPLAPTPTLVSHQQSPALPEPEQTPAIPLDGAWVARRDGAECWLFFERDGGYSEVPPDHPPPFDWARHRAAGHSVGRFTLADGHIQLISPTGDTLVQPFKQLDDYTVVLGQQHFHRGNFDLTGRTFSGRWRCKTTGETVRFSANGTFYQGDNPHSTGTYTLSESCLEMVKNTASRTLSLFSDLQPDPTRPMELLIGGTPWDRI